MNPSYFPPEQPQPQQQQPAFQSTATGYYPNVDDELNTTASDPNNNAHMMASYNVVPVQAQAGSFVEGTSQSHFEVPGSNTRQFIGQQYGEATMEWPQAPNAQNVVDMSHPAPVSRESVPTIVEQPRGLSIHNMSEQGQRFLRGFVEGKVSSKHVPAEFLRRFGRALIWAADNVHANADGAAAEETETGTTAGYESGMPIFDEVGGPSSQVDASGNRLRPILHARPPSPRPSRGAGLSSLAGSSNRPVPYPQHRLTVQTNFPPPSMDQGAAQWPQGSASASQGRYPGRSPSGSPVSRSPISAGSSPGSESHLSVESYYPSSPGSSTSSIGDVRITCLWDRCMLPIEGCKSSHIAKHLREVHFAGTWHEHSRGPCMWDGCTATATFYHGSFGKHIASTHLRITKVTCEFCGRSYSRGDSMNRHIGSHHPHAISHTYPTAV